MVQHEVHRHKQIQYNTPQYNTLYLAPVCKEVPRCISAEQSRYGITKQNLTSNGPVEPTKVRRVSQEPDINALDT